MTRPPVDTPQKGAADPQKPAEALSHQERVYFEMFRAIEQLGRKLEKAEAERFVMSQRLADIEAGAERDETTGRFYLPAKIEPAAVPPSTGAHRFALPAALASLMLGVLTLGVFVTQDLPLKTAAQGAAKTQTAAADFFPPSRLRDTAHTDWHAGKAAAETAAADVPAEPAKIETAEKIAAPAADVAPETDVLSLAAAPPMPQEVAEELSQQTATELPVDMAAYDTDTGVPYADADLEAHHAEEDFADIAALDTGAVDVTDELDVVEVHPVATPVAAEAFETRLAAVVEDLTASVAAEQAAAQKTAAEKAAVQAEEKPVLLALATPAKPAPENKAENKASTTANALPPMMMRDARLAVSLQNLEQSAFAGNPEAQHDLASLYAEGRDVPRDYTRARGWFMHAASAGIANAHYNLGVMTQQGLGTAADIAAAYTHYNKAAQLGHPEAMYNIGLIYAEGLGVEKSAARAAGYFKRAANAGMVQAAYNLGVLYEGNALGKPDIAVAIEWYEVAAAEGNRDAALAVRRLSRTKAQAAAGG